MALSPQEKIAVREATLRLMEKTGKVPRPFNYVVSLTGWQQDSRSECTDDVADWDVVVAREPGCARCARAAPGCYTHTSLHSGQKV